MTYYLPMDISWPRMLFSHKVDFEICQPTVMAHRMDRKLIYSEKEQAEIILGIFKFLYGVYVVLFLINSFAPLFGGKFIWSNIAGFAYWTGVYLLVKFWMGRYEQKIKFKLYQNTIFFLYFSIPLWSILIPYNFVITFFIGLIVFIGIQNTYTRWDKEQNGLQ